MYKLFKKFGSLALVICTVVALAALPVSAENYQKTFMPDTPKTDANGNTFNPGISIKGEDAVYEYVKMSGVIRTYTHDLSSQVVYALASCVVNHNDAAHSSSEMFYCCEYLGIVEADTVFILNSNGAEYKQGYSKIHITNTTTTTTQPPHEWSSVSGRAMLSTQMFTKTSSITRFPSRLSTFDWSRIVSIDEILES